ncbi:NPC intracellular cholesterol transporter 2 homolog a-like [Gigantopelta aegis]|uniref:NPC intracellular cholesterol transporter 2 homolog a-like n=1 Tax=Gigantopelta aegis TaxID=1735272 RepID=UPI001B88C92F|nr:NPC intracellular cholesterol transporter 2 homolog a-like [Gigantopelta aegis]
MSSLLILLLVCCCYEASAYDVKRWKQCTDPQKGKVYSLESSEVCDASTCHLKRGSNVTFTVHFSSGEAVTKAKAVVYGYIDGIKIKFPLPNTDGCQNCGLTCPLKNGPKYAYHAMVPVQKAYPKIKLVVIWYLMDQSGNNIWCIDVPAVITD